MATSSCSSSGKSDDIRGAGDDRLGAAHHGRRLARDVRDPAALGSLKVTVSNPMVESDADGPFLTLTVRAENKTSTDVQSPQFQLHCSGDRAGGAWLTTSTFKQEDPVPPLSFNEGVLSLLVPGDDRGGGPRSSCASPATVVATLLAFDNVGASPPKEKRVEWAVPSELVAQLNAA